MLAGAAELGLVRGKLHNPLWRLCTPFAFLVSGGAFLLHEQNAVVLPAIVVPAPLPRLDARRSARCSRSRARSGRGWALANAGFALVFVVIAVALYADRDLAPVFGHLSPLAGQPHR